MVVIQLVEFTVKVSNHGIVYRGTDELLAQSKFRLYVHEGKETVDLLYDGQLVKQYDPD